MRPFLLCVGLVAALPLRAWAEAPRPKVAVLGLRATGVDDASAASLTGVVGTEITRLGRHQVLGIDDVQSLLSAAQLTQLMGCEGEACSAAIGRLGNELAGGRLVMGTLSKLGEAHVLNLSLVDAKTGKVENRATTQAPSIEAMPEKVRGAVLALFGIAGQLVLWNQPEGAQVFLDEKLVGTAPVPKLDLPREGTYTVRVFRDDSTPFEKTVTVAAGEIVRVKVESTPFTELDQRASGHRGTGVAFVVGGGLAVAGAGALWLLALQNDARLEGLDPRVPDDVAAGRAITDQSRLLVTGAVAAGLVGAGLAAYGAWLLASNPAQDTLEKFTVVPLPGGALVATRLSF